MNPLFNAFLNSPLSRTSAFAHWSVRTFLTWLVFACLLPGIIGATALFIYEYRQGRAQLERDTIQTARALVQAVDNQILRVQALTQGLATADSLSSGDLPKFHQQARRALEQSQLGTSVILTDQAGNQILNTAEKFGMPLPFHGSPEMIRRVVETGRPVISNIFFSPVLNRPLMAVTVPVVRDRSVAFTLGITVLPDEFNSILHLQGLPAGWVATVFDGTGTIAARSRASEEFVGQKPSNEFFKELMKSGEGTFEATMKDGVSVLAAHSLSSVTNWRVSISIPQEALASQMTRRLSLLALGIASLFAIGLGLAWLMGGKIARSFQALIAPAVALGSGEAVSLPAVAVKEASEVTRALGEAAKLLEKRNAALHGINQTLRDSEYRLALALKAGGTAVWEMDVATRTLLPANDLLFTMLGYVPGELPTMDEWISLLHDEDRPGVSEMLEDVIRGRRDSYWTEARYRAKDGNWRWLLCQAVAAERNDQELATRLVGTHTDITDRKQAEAEIRRLNAGLEQRVRTRTFQLEQSNEALLRSNMELQRFAHAAAHDLQTPLRSITGFSQLVQRELQERQCAGEQVREWLAQVIDNTKRLQILIQELLAYSRLDAQARPFERVDLREVFKQVVTMLKIPISEAGAEITCGNLPTLMADQTQIAQLLQNLIENGIKYNQSRPPRVSVTCERQGQEWVFAVADNGIGIEPKHHKRIFEIFRRLHSHQDIPGTGIGLAICQRIVDRHGGRLWVESKVEAGSVFYFSLLYTGEETKSAQTS